MGGWIQVINGEVQLHGAPPARLTLPLALQTALHAADAQPNESLLNWLHSHRNETLAWCEETTLLFLQLLDRGNSHSWRLLDATNVMSRVLPNFEQMPTLEALRSRLGEITIETAALPLAAFVTDTSMGTPNFELLHALVIPQSLKNDTESLVSAAALLYKACTAEPFEPNQRVLAQIAAFLGNPLMVERCRQLTEARGNLTQEQFSVLLDITTQVQALLAHPELLEGLEDSLESIRRRDAIALTQDPLVIERLRSAAPIYVLANDADVLVRHATLVEPVPPARHARVSVNPTRTPQQWEVNIATRDMRGLLARITATLAEQGLHIVTADLATWPDGAVLDSFIVHSISQPSAEQLTIDIEKKLGKRLDDVRLLANGQALSFTLENDAHPWHSVVSIQGADQPGLVHAVATAFAQSNINVHHAHISTLGQNVADRFEVSTRLGRKLDQESLTKLQAYFQ